MLFVSYLISIVSSTLVLNGNVVGASPMSISRLIAEEAFIDDQSQPLNLSDLTNIIAASKGVNNSTLDTCSSDNARLNARIDFDDSVLYSTLVTDLLKTDLTLEADSSTANDTTIATLSVPSDPTIYYHHSYDIKFSHYIEPHVLYDDTIDFTVVLLAIIRAEMRASQRNSQTKYPKWEYNFAQRESEKGIGAPLTFALRRAPEGPGLNYGTLVLTTKKFGRWTRAWAQGGDIALPQCLVLLGLQPRAQRPVHLAYGEFTIKDGNALRSSFISYSK